MRSDCGQKLSAVFFMGFMPGVAFSDIFRKGYNTQCEKNGVKKYNAQFFHADPDRAR